MKPLRLFSSITLLSLLVLLSAPSVSAQDAISLDKVNYIALSPEAATLHDAVNYPADGNKGVPDISIPLYTIKYGKLSIPIVLRYSTTNAKVDRSVAPNVGFGWVLDVGGSVNRVIKGKPDEASTWYQADQFTHFDQLGSSDDQYTISSLYGFYGPTWYDTEKDEFTMTTPTGAASFYLTESSGTYTGHFSPSVNWKVAGTVKSSGTVMSMFNGIEVLDGDGTRYRFGSGSASTTPVSTDAAYMEYCTYDVNGSGTTYATGWQLREAEDDAGNKVSFEYTRSGNYTYSSGQDQWYRVQDSVRLFWYTGYAPDGEAASDYLSRYFPTGENTEMPYSLTAFRKVFPSRISWPLGSVDIVESSNHISSVTVKDHEGNIVRKYVFKTRSNNINTAEPLLDSINVYDASSILRQSYILAYNNVINNTVSAPSCDWWGYFNGTTSSQNCFLPTRSIGALGYNFSTSFTLGNGGHRSPDTTYIQHNILKRITYPGGGYTEFTFEPNTYTKERGATVTGGTGPGLRIKTVEYKDKGGAVLRKTGYTYAGGSISAIPDSKYCVDMVNQLTVHEAPTVGANISFITVDRTRTITPKYVSRVSGGGEAVDYDMVTETVYAGSTALGRTERTFTVPQSFTVGTTGFLNANECLFPFEEWHLQGESLNYNTSKLTKTEEYDGGGHLVRRTTLKWVEDVEAEIVNLGFYHGVYYNHPQASSNADSGLLPDYWSIRRMDDLGSGDAVAPLYYYLYTSTRGVRYPGGETVETFGIDSVDSVSTSAFTTDRTLAYTLMQDWHYPATVSTSRSDGRTSVMRYTYPFTSSGAMMDSLVGRHIVSPVVGQALVVGGTQVDTARVTYVRLAGTDAPGGYLFRPSEVRYAKGSSNPPVRITYAEYDSWGNPRSIVYGKDDTENHVWSYSHTTPVAKVTGASWSEVASALGVQTLGSLSLAVDPSDATVSSALSTLRGISDALVEGRTLKPLYGVSGAFDPAGRKEEYAYDGLQRLTTVKDNAAKVTMAIEYNDATGAGNSYVKVSTPDTALGAISSVAAARRRTVAHYYDGQYREVQTVQAYGSGESKDLVMQYPTYDAWGRVTDAWLPYGSAGTGGAYRPNYASEQSGWYSARYSSADVPYAKSRTEYESSPVGRVLREYLPGAGGYLTHGVKHAYGVNSTTDAVYRWNITASTSVVTRGSAYAAGTLLKELITDPDERTTITFTDRNGNVVETRVGNLRTSYVYNDAGLLVAVIPPKAQPSGTSVTSTMYYRYIYDAKDRLIESYVPDKGKTEFVYDADDRLVASQDALQSNDFLWEFHRYDRLGREVYSGIVKSYSGASTLRNNYASQAFHETRSASGAISGYTSSDTVLPVALKDVLTITYYDSYGYPDVLSFSAAGSDVGQSSSSVQSSAVKGLVTGRKAKVLDGNELTTSGILLTTSLYYNNLGRLIQEVGDIYTGGTAGTFRRSTLQRHQGEVAATKESQTVGSTTTTVLRKYGYDYAGRLTSIQQGLDGGTLTPLETDTWDAIGRQATRVLGTGTQVVNYAWDIRGRLTGINNPSSLGTDKFGISYSYETGTTPQYGGNISGETWAHAGGSSQTYAYTYDAYGRLTSGTHSGGNSEAVAYDSNGNLTSMIRTGARAETLAYAYSSGTNKLSKVTVGGVQKSYAYNADGTMKTDGLRGLTVTYSPVKLPNKIKVSSNTGTVDYIYDANGNKLAVKQGGTLKSVYCGDFVYDASLAVDYILTPNGQLTRNPSTGAYTTQYNITDHLGNVRSVVSSGNTVLQSTDYYPFGLAFSDANITNNRYLYNGKELEDYTIGTSYLGTLDYGARHYDPRIARWTVPDPMAEKYYGVNAYSYCAGNPVMLVDPDGQNWYSYFDENGELKYTYYEGQLSVEEIKEKGYTDLGYSYLDRSTGMYYSLFGEKVKLIDIEGRHTFEGEMYRRIDDLIIATYSNSKKNNNTLFSQEIAPLPSRSFYFKNFKHSIRPFCYDGFNFQSDRKTTFFNNSEIEQNSYLRIGQTPKYEIESLNGLFSGYLSGHFIVLKNNKGWDIVIINYSDENAEKIISAWKKLFPQQ